MHVKPASIKPHPTSNSHRLWLWNLIQTKLADVKPASDILAAFRHRDINMREVHIWNHA